MKKSIIAVLFIVLLAALFPILGNSFMKQTINDRITELKTFGLETKKDATDSSYLSTSRHIEFTIKDSQKFIAYLSSFADKQSPAYINAMLNGAVVGVDIDYSNLPFVKALKVEIFPLTLSDDMRNSLQKKDKDFLIYLQKFLQSKGIVYHINYNIVNKKFDGYIKDINQKYTLKDGTKVDVGLSKALFNGHGTLIAPDRLSSKMRNFHINIVQKKQIFDFSLEKLSSSTNFDSKSIYLSGMDIGKIDMTLQGTQNDSDLHLKDMKVNISSNTQGKNAKFSSSASFDTLSIKSKSLNIALRKFNFDITASSLDKKRYEILRKLLADNANQKASFTNKKVQESMVDLLSKGFVIKMAQFSLKSITIDTHKKLHGFAIKSEFRFLKDKNLAQKIKLSPMMAASDMEFTSKISIANELYSFFTHISPMLGNIKSYAIEEKDNLIFNIQVKDSKATVNGKTLN